MRKNRRKNNSPYESTTTYIPPSVYTSEVHDVPVTHTEAEKIFRLHKNNSELLSGALTGTEKIKTRGKTHDPVENQSQPELFN